LGGNDLFILPHWLAAIMFVYCLGTRYYRLAFPGIYYYRRKITMKLNAAVTVDLALLGQLTNNIKINILRIPRSTVL